MEALFIPSAAHLWLLIPVGILLRWAARIHEPLVNPYERTLLGSAATTCSSVLIGLGLLSLGWKLLVIGLILSGMAIHRFRLTESQGLMGYLAHAMQHRIPLSDAVTAYACEQHGDMCRRSLLLADLLCDGWPLASAFDRVRMTLPKHAQIAISLHDRDPRMAALVPLAAAHLEHVSTVWRTFWDRFLYFLIFWIVCPIMLTFISLKILPTFRQIFIDFEMPLPPLTHRLNQLASGLGTSTGGFMIGIFMLGVGVSLTVGPIVFIAYYTGWLTWMPRFLQKILFPLDVSFLYQVLAVACDQQIPLSHTLTETAAIHPSPLMRDRLSLAADEIERGTEWISALRRHHLLRNIDGELLRAAQESSNMSWAWHDMSEGTLRRWSYRVTALFQVLVPLLTLGSAAIVAFVAAGLFTALTELVLGLA